MQNVMPPHKLCVAPMMERTDRHCRYLLRLISPHAWLYTEMTTAKALLKGDHERLLRFDASEHPVALQLGGSDPEELAAAARLGEAAGFDEINLNVGCPSGRVQAGCFGVALMLDPEGVAQAIVAMREAVRIPVTVKCRIGVDDYDDYAFVHRFVRYVVDAGCHTVAVHARKAWLKGLSPKQNRDIPPLDYERVYRLKADFPAVEIVVNGGIDASEKALQQLEHVDGVMLGRSAYQNPMLIAELDSRILGTTIRQSRSAILESYLRYVERELAQGTPLKVMTRHLMGLYAKQPGGRRWRRRLGELPAHAEDSRLLSNLMSNH